MDMVRAFHKSWLVYPFAALAAFFVFQVVSQKPVLAYTPGEWDCACGDWYIYTTRSVLWNPFREREPERIAEAFLSDLRKNQCSADSEICRNALTNQRVSNWQLAFRKDTGREVTLYFKLTKYGGAPKFELLGQGAITLESLGTKWSLTSYDAYF